MEGRPRFPEFVTKEERNALIRWVKQQVNKMVKDSQPIRLIKAWEEEFWVRVSRKYSMLAAHRDKFYEALDDILRRIPVD